MVGVTALRLQGFVSRSGLGDRGGPAVVGLPAGERLISSTNHTLRGTL